MSQLQPVLWNKGAFLQPQHLQSQDYYLDSQLKFAMDAMVGYPWGFRSYTVDPVRLAGGYFSLASASGIFPDGLVFDIPRSDYEPEPRPIEGAFEEGQDTVTVLLAVPHYRAGAINVSFGDKAGANTRFTADVLELRDETTGRNEKPVQIARRNLCYLFPRDDQSGYSILRAARILKKGDRFELDRRFIPPLLHVAASSYLMSMLREVTGILSAKSQEHAQNRRGRGNGLVEVSPGMDTAAFWLHYTVNQHYPVFRYMLNNPGLHPQQQFVQMLSLAGALTAFTLKTDPNDLPVYNHDKPGAPFAQLDTMLRDLLETAIDKQFVALPLKQADQKYLYSVFIPEDRFLNGTRVFLAIKSEARPGHGIKASELRMAATGQIQAIINNAYSGVRLLPVGREAIPTTIPMKLGYQYFQVDTNSEFWQGVTSTQSLSVFVSHLIEQPVMELVIHLRIQS